MENPIFNWIKCNTDGASLGNPGQAACGGLFRNSSSDFIGGFAVNLGVSSALCSELIGAMLAIEIAHQTTSVLQSLGVVYKLQLNKTVLYLHQSDTRMAHK